MLKYRCGSFDNSIKSYIYLCGNKQVSHVFFPTVVQAAIVRAVHFLDRTKDRLVFISD